jgi:hypothetical protein
MHYPLVSFLITYQRHGLLSKKTNKKSSLDKGPLGLQMHDKSVKKQFGDMKMKTRGLGGNIYGN